MSDKIRRALKKLAEGPMQVIPGTVQAVDESNYTCDVKPFDDGPVYYSVRLKASVDSNDDGIVAIPEIDSDVLIAMIGKSENNNYVQVFTKIKSYQVKSASGITLKLTDTGELHLNGNSLDGLVKANELATQFAKTNAILQAFQQAISSWVVAPGDGGAALKALLTPIVAMQLTDLSNIKNNKVKHG